MKKESQRVIIGLLLLTALTAFAVFAYSTAGQLFAALYGVTRNLTTPQAIICAAIVLSLTLKPKRERK